jgi:hypothetical protein
VSNTEKEYFTVHEQSKILLDLGHACFSYEPKQQTDLPLLFITSEGKTRRIRHDNIRNKFFIVMDSEWSYFDKDYTKLISYIMNSCLSKSARSGKTIVTTYLKPTDVTKHLLHKHFNERDLDILRIKAVQNRRKANGALTQEEKDLSAVEKTEAETKKDIAATFHVPVERLFPKTHHEYMKGILEKSFPEQYEQSPKYKGQIEDPIFVVENAKGDKAQSIIEKAALFGMMYGASSSTIDALLSKTAQKIALKESRKPSIKKRVLDFLGFVDVKVSVNVPNKKDIQSAVIEGVKIE